MTEKEWLECTDPTPMLEFLRGKASDRKLRLFAAACCRSVWQMLADKRSQNGVEAAENYADNSGFYVEYSEASNDCLRAMEDASGDSESAELGHAKWHAATAAAYCTLIPFSLDFARDASKEVRQAESCYLFESVNSGVAVPYPCPEPIKGSAHAGLVRDIFGNPFRPATINPAWLAWNDRTAPRIAQGIYDERAFDRLPILADALDDAGCDNEDFVAHCRSEGPHFKGC